jgi:hypothetical protein
VRWCCCPWVGSERTFMRYAQEIAVTSGRLQRDCRHSLRPRARHASVRSFWIQDLATRDAVRSARLFTATHRPDPLWAMTMITLRPVVQLRRGPVLHARQHRASGRWVARGRRGRDPRGHTPAFAHRPLNQTVCSSSASLRAGGSTAVPVLIARALAGGPTTMQTNIPCVNPPFRADGSLVRPRQHRQHRAHALDPAIARAALHHAAACGAPRGVLARALADGVAHGAARAAWWARRGACSVVGTGRCPLGEAATAGGAASATSGVPATAPRGSMPPGSRTSTPPAGHTTPRATCSQADQCTCPRTSNKTDVCAGKPRFRRASVHASLERSRLRSAGTRDRVVPSDRHVPELAV